MTITALILLGLKALGVLALFVIGAAVALVLADSHANRKRTLRVDPRRINYDYPDQF